MSLEQNWLPKCLSHLNDPYLSETDETVVVAELSSNQERGYQGVRELNTALVPIDRLDEILTSTAEMGWRVDSWGPRPIVEEGQVYSTDFWIQGIGGRDDRLEPVVVGWNSHNKTVVMPSNGLLMTYGLSPRVQKDPDRIIWDDLSEPTYNVISVKPLSHYTVPNTYSGCEVKIDRRYLEDFSSLKGCAVVAVYYEDRWSASDDELEEILQDKEGVSLVYPGRTISISRNNYKKDTPIFCRIWGRRLILIPSSRPVSDEQVADIQWPGYPGGMPPERAFASGINDFVYVKDQVLDLFEGKQEYDINPLVGSVSYDGRWALSYCHRIGRDFIAYELRKLYEGCPDSIVRHVHRFSVEKEQAEAQRDVTGSANIGSRAEALIEAFIRMGEAIVSLSDRLGFAFQEDDVVSLSRQEIEYRGWWTIETLKPLSHRAAADSTKDQFLERCKCVYQLFEGIKEKPLRRLIDKVGLNSKETKDYRSLKLLASTLQLCQISHETGLDIAEQGDAIAERWDKELLIEELRPLFSLVDLRNTAGHKTSADTAKKVQAALEVFEIQEQEMVAGWGRAIDQVYDRMVDCLYSISAVISSCKD